MMAFCGVVCCVYDRSVQVNRLKLNEFHLNETVDSLKKEISKQTKISAEDLQIIHLGKLLDDYETLESCGVKPGVTIHAIRKPERETKSMITSPDKMDTGEVALQSLALALKAAVRNPAYRNTVRRLSRPEVLENIVAATPGLANDPIAIAILQDPDLLTQFTDLTTIQRVVEGHPALAEAINQVVAAVQEEGGVLASTSSSRLPRFLNLFWDTETDDDEFPPQSEQASSSDASRTPSQQELFPAITPAQLASALAAVATAGSTTTTSTSSLSEAAGPSTRIAPSTSTGTSTQSPSIITSELFSQAVQQAMSATTQSRLQQLRDMGITDDEASLRALAITRGDVQAALELIFGEGFNDDNRN